jgi:hypothetical protein
MIGRQWSINLKGYGRNWSWLNWSTIPALTWRAWGKWRKASVGTAGVPTEIPKAISPYIYPAHCIVKYMPSASNVKSPIFWDITPFSPLKVKRHFGGKCSLHLQGRRISQVRNQHEAGSQQSWFPAWLILRPWRWRRHILRNVGWVSTDYTELCPRRWDSS